jgi:hypothetical protein
MKSTIVNALRFMGASAQARPLAAEPLAAVVTEPVPQA